MTNCATWKLISATPSPYARKVRIAVAEKAIPFELVTEVPWNDDTCLPEHDPLEKLPVLGTFGFTDIAVGSMLGYLGVRYAQMDWRAGYPDLAAYADRLSERPSFRATVPSAQTIRDRVV